MKPRPRARCSSSTGRRTPIPIHGTRPGGRIEPGEPPLSAVRRELDEEFGASPEEPRPLGRFDDVDPAAGRVFRHHVFVGHLGRPVTARQRQRIAGHRQDALGELTGLGRVVTRSLAALAALEALEATP
jgi:8-oxo-dGTP pyrophosphatase MutT (NUDIX family)